MRDGTFNGWANRPTWAVAHAFDSDHRLALARKHFLLACRRINSRAVEEFVTALLPEGPPDFKDAGGAYSQVDWVEIADAWRSDKHLAVKI